MVSIDSSKGHGRRESRVMENTRERERERERRVQAEIKRRWLEELRAARLGSQLVMDDVRPLCYGAQDLEGS